MVTICCVCHKTKTEGGWIFKNLPVKEVPSHGYCPCCAEKVLEELRQYRSALAEVS